jgi:hypothetical protein
VAAQLPAPRRLLSIDRNRRSPTQGAEMSSNPKTRPAAALAGAAIASALVVPGAAAGQTYQDLRSPDAVDAARAAGDSPHASPPAPSVALVAKSDQDLRSPDTRDRANGYDPALQPQTPARKPASPGGFDVPSALLGAVAGTGLLIVLLAAGGLARRRPSTGRHRAVRA